ncbi:MAG: type II CRISPR-associated endonuclease Cas1 [Phycisphaeraceae bacterium]|nr:type II CRISPR-associated endonuclease Cas1 [Phycisphaeraceae bacterium]
MIKHTIEISQKPAHLTSKLEQLVIEPYDPPDAKPRSIPCEDIGMVIVDHPRTTYSHAAFQTLLKHGATLVICGKNHLPSGILIPISDNTQQVCRLQDQINLSKPTAKKIWKQIITAKILAQRNNLSPNSPASRSLKQLAKDVKAGDPQNHEAQAAKKYWSCWLNDLPQHNNFKRNQNGIDPANAFLNYGYAILRAAVARALVAAGLHPALGVHHHNRANAFCLADDLMEPLRPLVDRRVRNCLKRGRQELDQLTKAYLLELLAEPTALNKQAGPLMVQLHRYVASLLKIYQDPKCKLEIPTALPLS